MADELPVSLIDTTQTGNESYSHEINEGFLHSLGTGMKNLSSQAAIVGDVLGKVPGLGKVAVIPEHFIQASIHATGTGIQVAADLLDREFKLALTEMAGGAAGTAASLIPYMGLTAAVDSATKSAHGEFGEAIKNHGLVNAVDEFVHNKVASALAKKDKPIIGKSTEKLAKRSVSTSSSPLIAEAGFDGHVNAQNSRRESTNNSELGFK